MREITDITELVNFIQYNYAADDNIVHANFDFDFNNEGWYYHTTDFFVFNNEITTILDGGLYENGQLVRNHVFSNAYMYPNSYFIKATTIGATRTVRNFDFEIVTNNSYVYGIETTQSNAQINFVFENCNFNIKVSNISNAKALFYGREATKFINCTFNIEIASALSSECFLFQSSDGGSVSYSGYVNIVLIFESCEFRIKNNIKNFDITLFKAVYSYSYKNTFVNNCAFFLNNYIFETGTSKIKFSDSGSSPAGNIFINSFIAAFADTDNGTIPSEYRVTADLTYFNGNLLTCFYDKDRINVYDANERSVPTLYALTTAECKSENKLKEIGFLFATES
jgi:hypothetical protein